MKSQTGQKKKENSEHKLRREAEAKLAGAQSLYEMKERKTDEIIHELQVHQIELEMQNEELRRAQLALEEIKNRYVELYDFAPVGYFTITRDGMVREVNLTGAVFLGHTRQELINYRFGRFVVPGDRELWNRHILGTLNNWENQSCELMLRRYDGSTLFVRLDSVRMETPEGTPEIRIAMTDITHRRIREEDSRSVHDNTVNMIDNVREPLIVLDEKLKVVSASHSFYQTFGVSPGETVGSSFYDIGNRQWNIPKLRELLEYVLPKQTKIENIEMEHKIPSLGCRKIIMNARNIPGKEGKTQFILLAMKDVTEHLNTNDT